MGRWICCYVGNGVDRYFNVYMCDGFNIVCGWFFCCRVIVRCCVGIFNGRFSNKCIDNGYDKVGNGCMNFNILFV